MNGRIEIKPAHELDLGHLGRHVRFMAKHQDDRRVRHGILHGIRSMGDDIVLDVKMTTGNLTSFLVEREEEVDVIVHD